MPHAEIPASCQGRRIELHDLQVLLPVAGLLSAAAVSANILGNLAAGALLSRRSSRSALIAIASIVMGIAGLGILLPILAPVVSPAPRLAPITVGMVMQGSGLEQVIGLVAVGRAIETFGWPSAATIVAFAALLSVALARSLRRTLHARTFPAISRP